MSTRLSHTSHFFFFVFFFFFNDTETTEIYTLALHDALPILSTPLGILGRLLVSHIHRMIQRQWIRSEEHTSELQSRENLVCRLLLEKKKKKTIRQNTLKKKQRCTSQR